MLLNPARKTKLISIFDLPFYYSNIQPTYGGRRVSLFGLSGQPGCPSAIIAACFPEGKAAFDWILAKVDGAGIVPLCVCRSV